MEKLNEYVLYPEKRGNRDESNLHTGWEQNEMGKFKE
jgi:hypothetical protein